MNNFKNVIISSWAAAGGTTMALILANAFRLNYVYAGGTLKAWADAMGYDSKTNALHTWEEKYGEAWDIFWENYIQTKLENDDGFLCEGKTLGFLVKKEKAFSIMVVASKDVRAKRANIDERTEQIETRDGILRERWKRLFDIDFMDLGMARSNYNIVLDNSEMSIKDSIEFAVQEIGNSFGMSESRLSETMTEVRELVQKFQQLQSAGESKKYLQSKLQEMSCYFSPETIFADWLTERYSSDFQKLPEEMRNAVKLSVKSG